MRKKIIFIGILIFVTGVGCLFAIQKIYGLQLGDIFNAGGYRITNVGTPIDSNDAATKAYVDASAGKVQWVGYTANSYTGNLGGVKGANEKCNAEYPGSRALTYDDWLKLGSNMKYDYYIWVLDGSYKAYGNYGDSGYWFQMSKDGSAAQKGGGAMCAGWRSDYREAYGPVIAPSGWMRIWSCAADARLGCVK